MDELLGEIRKRIVEQGWSATARKAEVHRVTLHRMFGTTPRARKGPQGPKGPDFGTVCKVADAVGLKLRFE